MTELIDLGTREDGSFRDPSGHVHVVDGRVFRTIKRRAKDEYDFVKKSGLLDSLLKAKMHVLTEERDLRQFKGLDDDVAYVLEHERLPWISFPYEWTFSALKKAALLHLDIQIEALGHDIVLSDASAYNIQFVGTQPVFIDTLSFRRYREGEFWIGHRQFCEQFLNPLLLGSLLGIHHNYWYRGSLEGIDTLALNSLVSWRQKLSWKVLSNITLQAKLQQRSLGTSTEQLSELKKRSLSRNGYHSVIRSLREWIASLQSKQVGETVWQNYSRGNTYSTEEAERKHLAIQQFAKRAKPRTVWDLGCNTGEYSETLLSAGVDYVVGMDFDHGALENAFARAEQGKLRLQPLFQDAANPSPGQGWRGRERKALECRSRPDAIVALAFEHHLTIGKNVPIEDVVDWLTSLAPQGLIEFVQKSDETIKKMLALREDIFTDYCEENFLAALERVGRIIERTPISSGGRVLFWYQRA